MPEKAFSFWFSVHDKDWPQGCLISSIRPARLVTTKLVNLVAKFGSLGVASVVAGVRGSGLQYDGTVYYCAFQTSFLQVASTHKTRISTALGQATLGVSY